MEREAARIINMVRRAAPREPFCTKAVLPIVGLSSASVQDPEQLSEERAQGLGLTPDQRTQVNRDLAQGNDQYMNLLRALYREVTGESGDNLDVMGLQSEIQSKTPRAEQLSIRARVSKELAGQAATPPVASQSPYERLLRASLGAGDALEQALARDLGAAKAHELRTNEHGPFGWHSRHSGCSDGR
jgi:hypothetical protein